MDSSQLPLRTTSQFSLSLSITKSGLQHLVTLSPRQKILEIPLECISSKTAFSAVIFAWTSEIIAILSIIFLLKFYNIII